MEKHSPGPWAELGFSGYDLNLGIDVEPRTGTSSGPVIARVHVTNQNEHARQRALANARLIAAAPELLAACFDAVQLIQHDNSKCPFGVSYRPKGHACECSYHAAYDAIRAAIAKAEGSR